MKLLVFASLLVCALALPLSSEWEAWKAQHGKKYSSEEELVRYEIWLSHMKFVEEHNKNADKHGFTTAMNEFGDLSGAEFAELFNGYLGFMAKNRSGITYMEAQNVEIPTSVDWRTRGVVTPVKNQGQCRSCWAFSATGSLEGQHALKTGQLVSLSEQQLVDCSSSYGNFGCAGGWMDNAFRYIRGNGGVDTEESYPYVAHEENCNFNPNTIGATNTGYVDIPSEDERKLTKAIATVGPISVAIDASHMSFKMYSSGVYYEPSCSPSQLDHGVLAVGYGVDGNKDYYIVKNSWGASWGMNGYIWMSRNRDNNCGIATVASYPTV